MTAENNRSNNNHSTNKAATRTRKQFQIMIWRTANSPGYIDVAWIDSIVYLLIIICI